MTIKDTAWRVKYPPRKVKENKRLLLSLPVDLYADLEALAKLQKISVTELMRRAATQRLAEFQIKSPDLLQLRGRLGPARSA